MLGFILAKLQKNIRLGLFVPNVFAANGKKDNGKGRMTTVLPVGANS